MGKLSLVRSSLSVAATIDSVSSHRARALSGVDEGAVVGLLRANSRVTMLVSTLAQILRLLHLSRLEMRIWKRAHIVSRALIISRALIVGRAGVVSRARIVSRGGIVSALAFFPLPIRCGGCALACLLGGQSWVGSLGRTSPSIFLSI
jgi:hypothetical protein|tara:strand:+ start:570 stop:1013 length:444 start_codon:yes stop_codon:yes gene_type:complete